ncbi:hypothetical protein ACHAXM_011187, partial [Skeletonema potamos]
MKRKAEEQRRDEEERERVLAAIRLLHSAATKIQSQFRRMKFVRLLFQTKTKFVAARTIQSVTRRLLARRVVALLREKQQHMKSPVNTNDDIEHPLLMQVEHDVDDTSSIPQQSGKSCSCGQDSCVECCIANDGEVARAVQLEEDSPFGEGVNFTNMIFCRHDSCQEDACVKVSSDSLSQEQVGTVEAD